MESKTPDGVNGTDFLIIKFSKKSNGKAFLTDWKSTVDNLTIRYLKRVVVFTRAVDHLHVYTHLLDQSLQNLTKEKRFKLAKNWYDSFAALKDESAYIKFGFMSRDYHHEEDRLFVRSDMPSMTHCSLDGINDLIGTIRTVRANFDADETQAALAFMNAYKLLQDSLRAMVASRETLELSFQKQGQVISFADESSGRTIKTPLEFSVSLDGKEEKVYRVPGVSRERFFGNFLDGKSGAQIKRGEDSRLYLHADDVHHAFAAISTLNKNAKESPFGQYLPIETASGASTKRRVGRVESLDEQESDDEPLKPKQPSPETQTLLDNGGHLGSQPSPETQTQDNNELLNGGPLGSDFFPPHRSDTDTQIDHELTVNGEVDLGDEFGNALPTPVHNNGAYATPKSSSYAKLGCALDNQMEAGRNILQFDEPAADSDYLAKGNDPEPNFPPVVNLIDNLAAKTIEPGNDSDGLPPAEASKQGADADFSPQSAFFRQVDAKEKVKLKAWQKSEEKREQACRRQEDALQTAQRNRHLMMLGGPGVVPIAKDTAANAVVPDKSAANAVVPDESAAEDFKPDAPVDNTMRDAEDLLYTVIHKATGESGGTSVGGSTYGELQQGSMQKILDMMMQISNVGAPLSFIDLGGGLGKPALHAALRFPAFAVAVSIECDRIRHNLGCKNFLAAQGHLEASDRGSLSTDRNWFIHDDILSIPCSLEPFTHVYSFDQAFTPNVLAHVGRLLKASSSVTCFVSFHKLRELTVLGFCVELVDKLSVNMTAMGGTCARTTAYFYRPTCSAISLPLVEVRLAGTLLQCAEYFAPCIQNMQEKLIDNTTRPGGLELELRAQGIIEQEESSTTVVDPFVTNIEHLGHVCSDFTSLFQSPISSSEGVVNSIVGGISVLADLISTDIDNEAKIGVTIAELLLLRCSQPSVAHNLCERVNDFVKDISLELHVAALEKQSERLGKDTVILALLQTQRISKKRSRAEIASNVTACRGVVNLATSQPSFNKSILLHKVFKETPNFESLVAQINCDADPAVLKQQSTLSHIQVFRDKFTKSLYKHIHKWIRGGIFSLYCAYVVAATQFPDVTISEVIQDIAFLNNSEIFLYKNLLTNKSYVMDGLLRIDFRDLELLLKYAAVYPQNDSRYSVDFSKPPQYKDLPSKQDAVLRLRSVFHPLTSDLEEPRPRPPKNHYAGSQSSRPISGSVKKRSSNHKAINTKKAKQLKIKEISNDDQSVSQASAEVYSVNEESADEQSVPGANGQSVHDLSSDVSADALLAFKMQLLGETESSEASAVLSKSGSLLVQDLFNIPMTYDKLKCLDGKTWLNDEVINFMGNLLSVRDTAISAELKDRKRLLIMNSFFMAKLYENSVYDFEKVARWTKKEVVFKCRLIFIPVNCGNTHWVLVVIFMELKRVCCFDSMANVARGRLLIRLTLTWLRDVWRKQEEGDFPGGWSEEPAEPCPQQMNGCDCGVYVLAFMDFLADGFSTSHIDPAFIVNYRHKICTYIVSGVIADPRIDTITSCFHRTQSLQAAERAAVWSQEKLSNSAVVFVLVDDDDDAVSAAAVKGPSSSSNKAVTYTSEQEEQTAVSLKGGSSCDKVSADGDGSPGAQTNTPKDLEKMAGILASIGANVDPQDGILAHPVVRAIVQFLSDEGNSTSKKFKKKKNIDPYTLSLEQENARLREELSMLKNRN